jgi:hypothetical protein
MIDFVEECRREWKRLGVPDPIANEMAIDLTVDIEEAEAEGGSAEDVLGNSLFDPRRFAAAWASARGVTAPPPSFDSFASVSRERHSWCRSAMVIAVAVFGFLTLLAGAALVFGGRSSAVVGPIRHFVGVRGPMRMFLPGSVLPPFSYFVSRSPLIVGSTSHFAALVFALLLFGFVVLGVAILFWSTWQRRESKRQLW